MTPDEQNDFRAQYKSITYLYSELAANEKRLKQLHNWDKNGSHDKAILSALEDREALKRKLSNMLKGVDYIEWRMVSKRLSTIASKLSSAERQRVKALQELELLNFPI